MPNYWVGIKLSPPRQKLDYLEQKLRPLGGRVRERQVYTDANNAAVGYALIRVPPGTDREAVRSAIEATSLLEVKDLEEYADELEQNESTEQSAT